MQEKVEGEIPAPTPALEEARALTLQAAMAAGQVQCDCGMQVAPEDFVNGALKWGLMEVRLCGHCPQCMAFAVVSGLISASGLMSGFLEALPSCTVAVCSELDAAATPLIMLHVSTHRHSRSSFSSSVSPCLQVVYEWAMGTKFGDICQRTTVVEGSIVRCA